MDSKIGGCFCFAGPRVFERGAGQRPARRLAGRRNDRHGAGDDATCLNKYARWNWAGVPRLTTSTRTTTYRVEPPLGTRSSSPSPKVIELLPAVRVQPSRTSTPGCTSRTWVQSDSLTASPVRG